MADGFKVLQCNDDDVLSFAQHTFKVGNFIDRWSKEFQRREAGSQISQLSSMAIGEMQIKSGEITWKSPINGIDCEFLRLGTTSWQKGKLRFQVGVEVVPNERELEKKVKVKVSFEFCPDVPEISQPESPLDDIRRMINQESQ